MKYQLKHRGVVEAVQWNTHGDHPSVQPYISYIKCSNCDRPPHEHGNLNGYIVHPGDWIILEHSHHRPMSDEFFRNHYEPVTA